MNGCQFCGDDDATVELCLDCLEGHQVTHDPAPFEARLYRLSIVLLGLLALGLLCGLGAMAADR